MACIQQADFEIGDEDGPEGHHGRHGDAGHQQAVHQRLARKGRAAEAVGRHAAQQRGAQRGQARDQDGVDQPRNVAPAAEHEGIVVQFDTPRDEAWRDAQELVQRHDGCGHHVVNGKEQDHQNGEQQGVLPQPQQQGSRYKRDRTRGVRGLRRHQRATRVPERYSSQAKTPPMATVISNSRTLTAEP